METYLIMGYGLFGQKAAYKLNKFSPAAKIIVVEPDVLAARKASAAGFQVYRENAVGFMLKMSAREAARWWIIPALPIHLAYEWLVASLQKEKEVLKIPVPRGLDLGLPLQVRGKQGSLYLSFANFICPEDCPEPDKYCTQTKLPRKKPLYRLLEEVRFENYQSLVITSQQLAPGTGGYTFQTLLTIKEKLLSVSGYYLISTSCKCNAVTDAFCVSD